jgi:hypothetical protein
MAVRELISRVRYKHQTHVFLSQVILALIFYLFDVPPVA